MVIASVYHILETFDWRNVNEGEHVDGIQYVRRDMCCIITCNEICAAKIT